MVILAISFLSWDDKVGDPTPYGKSQTILLIRKGMSLYWGSGHRQIQTLGDVSFSQGSGGVGILTLFHRQQKKTNHVCTVVSKNLMIIKKERKNLKDFMPTKMVCLSHTKTELGSTKLF